MKQRVGIAILVLVAAMLVAWITLDGRAVERRSTSSSPRETQVAEPGITRDRKTAVEEREQRAETDARVLQRTFRVRDSNGVPIAGALVTWTALLDVDSIPEMNWQCIDWAAVAAATVSANTDTGGIASFDSVPEESPVLGSVIWVTSAGYEAACRVLSPAATEDTTLCELELVPKSSMRTRVEDSSGNPVAGATVTLFGLASPRDLRFDPTLRRAYRLFTRGYLTDDGGTADVGHLGAIRGAFAHHRGELSAVWISDSDEPDLQLTLKLRRTITVTGRVLIDGVSPTGLEGAFVSSTANVDGQSSRNGDTHVRADGTFGPWTIAVVEAQAYYFALDGGGLEPRTLSIEPAAFNAAVELVFDTRRGKTVHIRIVDESAQPIQRAVVSIAAVISGDWETTYGRSAANGIAVVRGCFDVPVALSCTALGYVAQRTYNVELDTTEQRPHEVTLERAGILDGVCRSEGTPVTDFTLIYWVSDPYKCSMASFTGRHDGSFRIEDAPVGPLHLMATTTAMSRMEPVRFEVRADDVNRVELDLPGAMSIRGRVVDAATSAPVAGAEVVAWSSYRTQLFAESGARAVTNSNGEYELRGLGPGNGRCEVRADGYASGWHIFCLTKDGQDAGIVSLAARQSLTVSLTGLEGGDYTGFELSFFGRELAETRVFDASGVLVVPGMSAGPWQIVARSADGSREVSVRVFLASGTPWSATIPFASDRSLSVRIEAAPGAEARDDLSMRFLFVRPDGHRADSYHDVPRDGTVEVHDVSGDGITVEVLDPEGVIIGSAYTQLRPGPNSLTVLLAERRLDLRVVGSSREPIEGVQVVLTQPALNASWSLLQATDSSGVAHFACVPFKEVHVALWHPDHGTRTDVLVEVEDGRANPIEIELDARAPLRLEMRDRGTPLPGIFVQVTDQLGEYAAFYGASDGDARVETERFCEGTFYVRVNHPGIWPAFIPVQMTGDGAFQVVQLRRTGGIEFALRNSTGADVVNTPVVLRSFEFDVDVAHWLAEGRVSASSSNLSTDSHGRLSINGLPNGEYSWSAGDATGVIIVSPHAKVSVVAVVP